MKLIIASNNAHKVSEIKAILGCFYDEILSLREAGIDMDVVEDANTFEGNALKKAREVFAVADADAVLSDDSGLMVDALGGAPGVYSARFGGEGLDDTGRYRLLLQMMHGQADRRAHFHTTITCAFPNGDVLQDDGEVEGTIAFAPMGENGFGYDPLFYYEPLKKSFAQLTPEEKNSVSHRRRALESLCDKLRAEK